MKTLRKKSRLIIGTSEQDADLLYATKFFVPDDFIWLEHGGKSFAVMKKHFKAYVNGFDGAKELRMKLMDCENADQVDEIISDYIKNGLK